jgi:hypothetical protein
MFLRYVWMKHWRESSGVRFTRMDQRLCVSALFLMVLAAQVHSQSSAVPAADWKQLASPEQGGWSAGKLAKIRDYVEEIGSTSAMIVQHGVVVVAWGDIKNKSNLHSCT